jgi:hypothetical protein
MARRQFASIRKPMASIEADNRKEEVLVAVEN